MFSSLSKYKIHKEMLLYSNMNYSQVLQKVMYL